MLVRRNMSIGFVPSQSFWLDADAFLCLSQPFESNRSAGARLRVDRTHRLSVDHQGTCRDGDVSGQLGRPDTFVLLFGSLAAFVRHVQAPCCCAAAWDSRTPARATHGRRGQREATLCKRIFVMPVPAPAPLWFGTC